MKKIFDKYAYVSFGTFALLNPKGTISLEERNLMVYAILLMFIIVIPAFIMLFRFAWKYREGNTKNFPAPQDNRTSRLVSLFWIGPTCIVLVLAFITWHTTHALDPYKPIASENPPITIQVVALRWKWLFIYPEQHIATVNFIQFPVNTPLHFELTADDTPMSSFWIPQLGGQMYAMTSMSNQLHLMATQEGDFVGSSAEINGSGFSGMKFVARSSSQANFDQWLASVKQSTHTLTSEEYTILSKPSENNPVMFYSSVDGNMYNTIIAKFMAPNTKNEGSQETMPSVNTPGNISGNMQ